VASLIWTPPALEDLAWFHAFPAPKNQDAARRAIRAIRQGVKTLQAHLEIGHPIEDMTPEFRYWLIPGRSPWQGSWVLKSWPTWMPCPRSVSLL
jgi:plasmid stabilization system protein ParE